MRETNRELRVFEDLSGFLGEQPSSSHNVHRSRKMSQVATQLPTRKSFSTRSLVLVILLVGVGAGTAAYVLGSASAAPTTASNHTGLNTYNGQCARDRLRQPLVNNNLSPSVGRTLHRSLEE